MSGWNLPTDAVRDAREANLDIMAAVADCLHRRTNLLEPQFEHPERFREFSFLINASGAVSDELTIFEESLARATLVLQRYLVGSFSKLLWMSFAISNDSGNLQNVGQGSYGDFGLGHPVFTGPNGVKFKNFTQPESLTKRYLKHFLETDIGKQDHFCFGLALHKGKASNYCGNLPDDFFPFHTNKSTRFHHAVEGEEWQKHQTHKYFSDWHDAIGTPEAYFEKFGILTGGQSIGLQLSATSIFRSLVRPELKAAAQFVAGFSTDVHAYEMYQLLQIILGGLPTAWNAITELRRREGQLSQYKNTYETMLRPLRNISSAIESIQHDTQTLSVLLYSPTSGLFASHLRLAEFFEDGHSVHVSRSIVLTPVHSGMYKDEQQYEVRLAMQLMIARVLGYKIDLPDSAINPALAARVAYLSGCAFLEAQLWLSPHVNKICRGLDFLVTGDSTARSPVEHFERFYSVSEWRKAIGNIKRALFTPFKMGSTEWPFAPLGLIFLEYSKIPVPKHLLAGEWEPEPGWSPVPYYAVLQLVIGICSAAQSQSQNAFLKDVKVDASESSFCLELIFAVAHPFTNSSRDPQQRWLARRMYEQANREEYLPALVEGNFHKPFLDLAARIHASSRIARSEAMDTEGSDATDLAQPETPRIRNSAPRIDSSWILWDPDTFYSDELLIVTNYESRRRFEVRAGKTVKLIWAEETAMEVQCN